MNWTDTAHCKSRAHCGPCRRQEPMRGMTFPVECPYGVTLAGLPAPKRIIGYMKPKNCGDCAKIPIYED